MASLGVEAYLPLAPLSLPPSPLLLLLVCVEGVPLAFGILLVSPLILWGRVFMGELASYASPAAASLLGKKVGLGCHQNPSVSPTMPTPRMLLSLSPVHLTSGP